MLQVIYKLSMMSYFITFMLHVKSDFLIKAFGA